MGYRVREVPLPRIDEMLGTLTLGSDQGKPRSMNYVDLPDVPQVPHLAPLSVDRNDVDTVVQGAAKRFAKVTKPFNERHARRLKDFTRKWCRRYLTPIEREMEFEEWLATTSYSEGRKNELRECRERYVRGEITADQLRKVKSHIKQESYPEYKHARHINARCDLAKVVFGPIIKAIEQMVYSATRANGDPIFIKHVPLPERPALLRKLKQAGCLYVESDHSAYEATIKKRLMELIEVEVVKFVFRHRPDIVSKFASVEMGANRLYLSSLGITIVLSYFRCSGDMWTSLMNGLVNIITAEFGVALAGGTFCGGFVEGDDGIFAVQGNVPTYELMCELGLDVKYIYHDDPATASFCGMILAGEAILRDPVSFFAGFGWVGKRFAAGRKLKRQLALAKSLSALYETPRCPLVASAAWHVYQKTRGVQPVFLEDGYHYVPRDYHPPAPAVTPEARDLFARLYGVSCEAQVIAESRIEKGDWSVIPEVLRIHPHMQDFATRFVERLG